MKKQDLARTSSLFLLATLATLLVAVLLGERPLDLVAAWTSDDTDRWILVLRMKRAILATFAGGGLAVVGAALQTLLRNPIVDPYFLGVSGGSAFGATCALAFGVQGVGLGLLGVPLFAFLGGLGATLLVIALATRASKDGERGFSSETLLFAGVLLNSFFSALITVSKAVLPALKTQELLRWFMGSLDTSDWGSILLVAIASSAGSLLLVRRSAPLNALSMGRVAAESVGVAVRRLELEIAIVASLIVGVVVSATGMIAFVGLVVPQAIRRTRGGDARSLLPLSFLGGAILLLLSDTLARLLPRWTETALPVGAITALLGTPLFFFLARPRSGQFSGPG